MWRNTRILALNISIYGKNKTPAIQQMMYKCNYYHVISHDMTEKQMNFHFVSVMLHGREIQVQGKDVSGFQGNLTLSLRI